MKKYLELNKKHIIRKEDKMLFSAEEMRIYNFNDEGFKIVMLIADNDGIEKEKLFDIYSSKLSTQELDLIINKMVENKIIFVKEK